MLNIFAFLLNLIDQHTIWLYAFCIVVMLFYVRAYIAARTQRANTIFTIEREVAAHREGQAMSSIGAMLGIIVVIMGIKYYLVPTVDVQTLVEPTPTVTLSLPTLAPTLAPTKVPDISPTATPRPRPTQPEVVVTVAPTNTPAPAPAHCPDDGVRITSPGANAVVSGRIAIRGTANLGDFQFYKIEWAADADPGSWHSISSTHNAPVINGLLDEFDTKLVPNGIYWLQLTVVDKTGNYPAPCAVRVVIEN